MSINNLSDFKIALVCAYETKVSTLFLGAPGSAKTAAMISIAEKMGGKLIPVLCSTMTPSDVLGFPYRDSEYHHEDEFNKVDGALKFSPPYWALEAVEAAASNKYKFVCLFFDELYTATPSVQAALLRPLNEGYVGNLYIGHIIRLAAANAKGQSSGFNISQALENRFITYKLNPTEDDWVDDFMLEKDFSIDYEAWDGVYKDMLFDFYTRYIKTQSIKLLEGDSIPNGAFPSKRSVTLMMKKLSFAAQNGIKESFVKHIISGSIGAACVNTVTAFYADHKRFSFSFDFNSNYVPRDVQRFFEQSYQVYNKNKKLTKEQQQKVSQVYVKISKIGTSFNTNKALGRKIVSQHIENLSPSIVREFESVLEKNSVILSEMLDVSTSIIKNKIPDVKTPVKPINADDDLDIDSIFGEITFSELTTKYPQEMENKIIKARDILGKIHSDDDMPF